MKIRSVLIADVVNSSKLPDESRQELDYCLTKMFAIFNEKYSRSLKSSINHSLGDEFQAVFESSDSAILPAMQIQAWLASQASDQTYKIRTAIGVGRVSVQTSHLAREQDGPAFHVARKLIETIHKQKAIFGIRCHGTSSYIQTFNLSIEISCRFISSTLISWTRPQWEAAYWRWEGESSRQVADRLGVRPQNISKRLISANFSSVNKALDGFQTLLRHPALLEALSQPH